MATCNKGSSYQSAKRGTCNCVADGTYLCADGTTWLDAGSAASAAEVIASQDRARAKQMPPWLPWALGGVALGAAAWMLLKK